MLRRDKVSRRGQVLVVACMATLLVTVGAAAGSASHGSPSAGYERARASIVEDGRTVAGTLASGDVDRLFGLFTPEFAQALPLLELRRLTEQMLESSPLEPRVAELALPLSPSARLYRADYRWGATTLGMSVVLNPVGQVSSLLVEPRRPIPPDPRARYRARTLLRLPFSGEWWTIAGGRSAAMNHHTASRSQRHGVDFVIWRQGGTHRRGGTANEQYWAWGKPVLAPARGTVVATQDGVADNRPGATNERAAAGNYVVLDFGNGEFALLAHFRRGSIRVQPGDAVAAGTILGEVGNSGNSSEPHLHIHLQDRKQLSERAVALPLVFVSASLNGRTARRVAPVSGQFVSSYGADSRRTTARRRCSASSLGVERADSDLPAPVRHMRAQIVEAARSCNYQLLERLGDRIGRGLKFTYGTERAAAQFWSRLEASGDRPAPLEALVKLLSMPHTRNELGHYLWPSAARSQPSPRDWEAIVRLYGRQRVDRMRKADSYLGYRIGITATGDWQYFIRGD